MAAMLFKNRYRLKVEGPQLLVCCPSGLLDIRHGCIASYTDDDDCHHHDDCIVKGGWLWSHCRQMMTIVMMTIALYTNDADRPHEKFSVWFHHIWMMTASYTNYDHCHDYDDHIVHASYTNDYDCHDDDDDHIVHRWWWLHCTRMMMIASYTNDDDSHHHDDRIVHNWSWSSWFPSRW